MFTSFSGKRLLAVSGLANPDSFQRVLDGLGLPVDHTLVFPNHHWFTERDIERIGDTIAMHQLDAIITTEKDEVRLGLFAERLDVPIYTVAITMQVQPAQEFEEFVLRMAAGENSKN
jgi:tetraacyldisaccharide 4'-kinase